ncbi:MAG: hypothetical protein GX458_06840 [Phyllobacteriaceae bacterium]|nr:hypothetical protein [Phyllobacteriaceae bacterium]
MKTIALSLASLVLVASAGLAAAEPVDARTQIVRPGVAVAAPVVEGRQAAQVAPTAGVLSPVDAYLIGRNTDNDR